MKSQMQRRIEQTADGSATLYVPELDEHYHSVKGAQTESEHIFIGLGMQQWCSKHPGETLHIFEAGFGTGLNALLALEEAERTQTDTTYISAELYPLCWEEVAPLHYSESPLLQALHEAPWGTPTRITPHFTLHKVQADLSRMAFPECDVVFYDAFAPEKQPHLWSEDIFRALWQVLTPGGILTTYCAKGEVRRRLQRAGFTVERMPGPPGGKREVLRATASEEV